MTFLRNIFQSGKNSKLLIAENPVQHKTFKLQNSNNKIDREWWCRLAPPSLKATCGERKSKIMQINDKKSRNWCGERKSPDQRSCRSLEFLLRSRSSQQRRSPLTRVLSIYCSQSYNINVLNVKAFTFVL